LRPLWISPNERSGIGRGFGCFFDADAPAVYETDRLRLSRLSVARKVRGWDQALVMALRGRDADVVVQRHPSVSSSRTQRIIHL